MLLVEWGGQPVASLLRLLQDGLAHHWVVVVQVWQDD